MSRKPGVSLPVIEWSPEHVRSALPGQPPAAGASEGFASVRAALSRRNTFVRGVRIPNVPASEAEKILRLQLPNTFPISSEELVFAYRLTNDVGPEGRLAVVAATRADTLRSLLNSLREHGANPEDVVASAFGSMLLASSMGLSDTAVVEQTPEGWAIDLVLQGELRYSRVVPLETHADALESEVCRTFGMAGLPCGSILAAGGARLEFATQRTEQSTLELLTTPRAASLGVSLELPEESLARVKRHSGNRARLAALLWVATVALGLIVGLDRVEDADKARQERAQVEAGTRKLKRSRDAAHLKVSSLAGPFGTIRRAFEPAQSASDVLAAVSALTPKGIWLTGITFERGKPVLIRGTAMNSADVAAYLDALSGEARFRDVKLVFANNSTIDDTQVSQFSISVHAIGNLPLADPKTKRGSKK